MTVISLDSCYLLTPECPLVQWGMFLLWPLFEKAPWQKKNAYADN